MRLLVTCLLVALVGGASHAVAADDRTVIVTLDRGAYRLQEAAFLEAQVRAAVVRPHGIEIVGRPDGVVAGVSDLALNSQFAERVRRQFAGQPGSAVDVQSAEAFHIGYAPGALKDLDDSKRALDRSALEQFVRAVRPGLAGVQIEGEPAGAIVRSNDPAFSEALERLCREVFDGYFDVAKLGEGAWRVTMKPGPTMRLGPARRLLTGAMIEFELRGELRDPLDLVTGQTREGVDVTVADPEHHQAFVDNLRRAFTGNPNFILSEGPGQVVRVSLAPGAAKDEGGSGMPVQRALYALQKLADPPVETFASRDGVVLRATDSTRNAEVAAIVRPVLADRPDLVVATAPDQSLSIDFAPGSHVSPSAPRAAVAAAVRARLKGLKLRPSSVEALGADRVQVRFASGADAESFRRALADRFGLSIRLVDDAPISTSSAPSPGDVRFPKVDGGLLWLRPAAVVSGEMVTYASAEVDEINRPDVAMHFTDIGGAHLAGLTAGNIGRPFAIVVNGVVVSAPVILAATTGNSVEITGDFTTEAAQALAKSITAYKEDVPLEIVDVASAP